MPKFSLSPQKRADALARTAGPRPTGPGPTVGFADGQRSVPPTVGRGPTVPQPTGTEPTVPVVEYKAGELRLPNSIVFGLWPLLGWDERVVYEELYLWTHGFGENPRIVSQKALQARLSTDDKRLARVIRKLEAKGLVRSLGPVYNGQRAARGTWFDVRLPQTVGSPPTVHRPAGKEPVGPQPDMKDMKARHESVSLEDLRREAAAYRARYPAASDDVVRARLRELAGKGSERLIDEALAG